MNNQPGENAPNGVAAKIDRVADALTRDARLRASGQAKMANGELEAKLGERLDELRAWTIQRPITALVVTACLGFFFGARWASQWHRKNA